MYVANLTRMPIQEFLDVNETGHLRGSEFTLNLLYLPLFQ